MAFRRLRGARGALLGAVAALALAAPAAAEGRALLVCNGGSCPAGTEFSTIQAAVNSAQNGDWIMVWPGTYTTPTNVTPRPGLDADLHIRGMSRSGVVLDGAPQNASHGIRVTGVDRVTIQNMTGKNFTHGSGNAFWWTDVDGYWGSHLTAYNTTNYGIYAYASTSTSVPAAIAYSYASWNADSGIYIGGCRDCNVVITDSISEHNALGYSGTNAGGGLFLINSEWANNAAGIVPNTLNSEPDFPQRGAVIANNWVHDNNADDVPRNGASDIAPTGYGILVAGGSQNIIRSNRIENQDHVGIGLEWLFFPPLENQIRSNTFKNVALNGGTGPLGPAGAVGDADISFGVASAQNCVKDNVDITSGMPQPASTNPPNVAGSHECEGGNPARDSVGTGLYGPGSPTASLGTVLNVAGLSEPRNYTGPGPAPEAKESMENPCAGAPDSDWCQAGEPAVAIP